MASRVAFTAFFTVILSAAVAPVAAEQATSTQTELLTEVRLLRQAIESLAGTNARVQIVFGRLTLQEQRTASAGKRLDDARAALAKVTQEIAGMTEHAEDVEEMLKDSQRKPEEIEQARRESVIIKRELGRLETERARLAADEAEAAQTLNQEQDRWSDLNRQLEELERALTKR